MVFYEVGPYQLSYTGVIIPVIWGYHLSYLFIRPILEVIPPFVTCKGPFGTWFQRFVYSCFIWDLWENYHVISVRYSTEEVSLHIPKVSKPLCGVHFARFE